MGENRRVSFLLIWQRHCKIFTYKKRINASYKYTEQNNPELNPKRNRAEDGKVKT